MACEIQHPRHSIETASSIQFISYTFEFNKQTNKQQMFCLYYYVAYENREGKKEHKSSKFTLKSIDV